VIDRPPTQKHRGLRRLLRIARWLVAAVLAPIVLYVLLGLGFAAIPSGGGATAGPGGVEIGVFTDPVHTDLVLPVRDELMDWSAWLPASAFAGATDEFTHVAFGWGDRGFYLETVTWSDLRASTACRAMFGLGTAAMHVEFHPPLDQEPKFVGLRLLRVRVDRDHYRKLVAFLQGSFRRDAAGRPIPIDARGYRKDGSDAFFEGTGRYSLLRTCNVWTCEGLAQAGQPAPLWSPFPFSVAWHLPGPR